VTVDDVIYSFEVFKKHNPRYGAYYRHVVKLEKTGEREITFTFDGPGNRELPQIVGEIHVLPKHWWEGTDAKGNKRNVGETTLEVPLGSGPYRIKSFEPGRNVVYERVKDFWARDLNINIGSLQTSGYDVNVGYTGLEMGRFGSLAFNLTGTYLDELVVQPVPGLDLEPNPIHGPDVFKDTYDCVGYYSTVCSQNGIGPINPQWRHRFRTSWQTPWDLDLSLTWRHYGGVTGLAGANLEMPRGQLDKELPAEDYFDLAANWAITEKAGVTLGINNVLDDNPSVSGAVGTTGNGNTYPQVYDALGRYIFAGVTLKL